MHQRPTFSLKPQLGEIGSIPHLKTLVANKNQLACRLVLSRMRDEISDTQLVDHIAQAVETIPPPFVDTIFAECGMIRWLETSRLLVADRGRSDSAGIRNHLLSLGNRLFVPLAQLNRERLVLEISVGVDGIITFPAHQLYVKIHCDQAIDAMIVDACGDVLRFYVDGCEVFNFPADGFLFGTVSQHEPIPLNASSPVRDAEIRSFSRVPGTSIEVRAVESLDLVERRVICAQNPPQEFVHKLEDAVELISACWSEGFALVDLCTQVVQPFTNQKPEKGRRFLNVVYQDFPGVSFLLHDYWEGPDAPAKLAEGLIHLAAHSLEVWLLCITQVCTSTSWFYAPWRREFRPADRVFSGVVAFTYVCAWNLALLRNIKAGRVDPWHGNLDCEENLAMSIRDLQGPLAGLQFHAEQDNGFTDVGRQLLNEFIERWREIRQEFSNICGDPSKFDLGRIKRYL